METWINPTKHYVSMEKPIDLLIESITYAKIGFGRIMKKDGLYTS